jgi:hypothetical protein
MQYCLRLRAGSTQEPVSGSTSAEDTSLWQTWESEFLLDGQDGEFEASLHACMGDRDTPNYLADTDPIWMAPLPQEPLWMAPPPLETIPGSVAPSTRVRGSGMGLMAGKRARGDQDGSSPVEDDRLQDYPKRRCEGYLGGWQLGVKRVRLIQHESKSGRAHIVNLLFTRLLLVKLFIYNNLLPLTFYSHLYTGY